MKISEGNYRWLSSLAGEIQKMRGKPVSLDETLSSLRGRKISDLAGSWTMSEKEVTEMRKNLHEGWHKWKIESA